MNGKNEGNVKDNAGVIDTAKIKNKVKDISKADDGNKSITELIYIQAFSFKGIDTAIKLSHILPFFHGIESTLFKDEKKK